MKIWSKLEDLYQNIKAEIILQGKKGETIKALKTNGQNIK